MSAFHVYALAAAGLFGIGVYGLAVYRHLLRKIIAINLMGGGVFLMLGATAARDPAGTDPVPQAMIITGLVVAVSATALALTLVRRLVQATGVPRVPDDTARPDTNNTT